MATLNHTNVTIAQKDVYPYNANKGFHKYTVNASPTTIVRFPLREDGTPVVTGETGLTKVSENPKVAGHNLAENLIVTTLGEVDVNNITAHPDWNTKLFARIGTNKVDRILTYVNTLTGADLLKTQKYCNII